MCSHVGECICADMGDCICTCVGLYMCACGGLHVFTCGGCICVHVGGCICAHMGGCICAHVGIAYVHMWVAACVYMWGLYMCTCVCSCACLNLGQRMMYSPLYCHPLTYSFESWSLLRPGTPGFRPRWQLSGPSHSLVSFLHDTGVTDTLKTHSGHTQHISRCRGLSLDPHGCACVFNH